MDWLAMFMHFTVSSVWSVLSTPCEPCKKRQMTGNFKSTTHATLAVKTCVWRFLLSPDSQLFGSSSFDALFNQAFNQAFKKAWQGRAPV